MATPQVLTFSMALAGAVIVVSSASAADNLAIGPEVVCSPISVSHPFSKLQDVDIVQGTSRVLVADAAEGVWICDLHSEDGVMNDCRSLIEAGFDKFKIPNVNRVSTFADQVAAYDLYSKRIVIKSLSGQNILHTVSDRMFGETRDIELAGDGVVQLGPVWDGDTFNPDGIAVTRVSHDGNVLHAEAIHAVKDTEAAEHFSLFFPMQESGISVDSEGRVWVITASEGEVFRYTDKGDLDYASDVFYDFRIPINKDLKSVLYKSFENRTMYLCDFPLIEGFETPTPEAALLVKKEPVGRDKKIGWQYRWIPSSEPTWRELASPNWADCFTTLRMSSSEDFTVLLYRRRSGDSNVSALYRCEASTPHLQ